MEFSMPPYLLRRILFAAVMLTVSHQAGAQALNPRWHGQWKSAEEGLLITEQAVKLGKEVCRWEKTVPQKVSGCAAFYQGKTTKAALMAQFEEADKAVQELLKDGSLKQGQKDRMRESMGRNRKALDLVSNDTFKMVQLSHGEADKGSGECNLFFFLDKESIYSVLNCKPAPEAYTIRPYSKAP